jgi:hypothetical protein
MYKIKLVAIEWVKLKLSNLNEQTNHAYDFSRTGTQPSYRDGRMLCYIVR